jgi:hypothetical protein
MQRAAYLYRMQALNMQGVEFDVGVEKFALKGNSVLV